MECRNVKALIAALLLIAGGGIGVTLLGKKPNGSSGGGVGASSGDSDAAVPSASHAGRQAGSDGTSRPVTKSNVTQRLDAGLSDIKSTVSPEKARGILAELRAYLSSVPSSLAAEAITDFLADPSADCSTRIEFAVGKNGSLSGQSSLRVALLDWLAEIDPQQAGFVAKRVLSTPTAADEWAVCLRNFARANPGTESNDFLRGKTEELIRNPQWRINPSVGFFESFDVLVHTQSTDSTDLLAGLVADRTPEGKAIAHASFLTLDRLAIGEPAAMIQQLASRPDLANARPEMVANIIARADLRDATQQQLVRDYLLDPARTSVELSTFAGIYPNANFSISNNLLTENTTLTHAELTARDAAALTVVDAWLVDPAFESVKPHLTAIRRRLANFANTSELAR